MGIAIALTPRIDADDPDDVSPEADELESTRKLLSRIRNGAWLDEQRFAALQWTIPGLIPEGFGLLVGPPKIGKSWFVLGVGLAAAVGGKALGHIQVEQRPVLYAALEDGDRRMQDRSRHLMHGKPLPKPFEYFTQATPDELLPIIETWLDLHPDGLVMLDTLGKVMPRALPGEGVYQRDYRIGGVLKRITDKHPGSTILVVHHKKKGSAADWMDSTSGTNGLNGSADFTILIERARGETEAIIRVTGRDVNEGEYAATADGGHWAIAGESLTDAAQTARQTAATIGLGEDSARIVEYVTANPGARPSAIAAALDLDGQNVRVYLGRLTAQGWLTKPERGRYMPVTSVTSSPVTNNHPTPPVRGVSKESDGRNNVTEVTPLPGPTEPTEDATATPTCTICHHALTEAGVTTHANCDPTAAPATQRRRCSVKGHDTNPRPGACSACTAIAQETR